jgi:IMP dehydrogenase
MIKQALPDIDVIAGNVVRTSQAKLLLEAGADGLRVGMGTGSVSTTQSVKAVGRAQLSAVFACSLIAREYQVPVIADGGIKNTGCVIKALAIGASCVMMGSMLAGTEESPGDYFFENGVRLKSYNATLPMRPPPDHTCCHNLITTSNSGSVMSPDIFSSHFGYGSPPSCSPIPSRHLQKQFFAKPNSINSPSTKQSPVRSERAGSDLSSPASKSRSNSMAISKPRQAPAPLIYTGVNGSVQDKGPLNRYFPYICQSIRHGLQDIGARSLSVLRQQLHSGELRFELRSGSAQKEGAVHDLHSFQQRLFA